MAVEQKVTVLPDLRGALRHGRDGRGRRRDAAAPRPRPPALARVRVPQGHRDDRRPERPRPRAPSAAPHAPTGRSSRSPGRRRSPTSARGCARVIAEHGPQLGRLVLRQPGRLLLLAHAVGQGLPRRARARRTTTRPPRRTSHNRFAASALLYGSPPLVPIPDLKRTRLPAHGRGEPARLARQRRSPRRGSRTSCTTIVARGGRVVVVDPRRTETARHFEHVAGPPGHATPGCCSRCCTCSSRRASPTRLRSHAQTDGAGALRDGGRAVPARGDRGRAPACRADDVRRAGPRPRRRRRRRRLRPHRLVPRPLRHARRVPDRRAQRRRPATSTAPAAPCSAGPLSRSTRSAEQAGLDTYGKRRSRVGGFPDVLGDAAGVADGRARSTTPGRRPAPRASSFSAGNPVLSVPDGEALERALGQARPAWSRSTSTSTRRTATPTTSCRRRRGSSATTSRWPSSASTRRRSSSTPTPSCRRAARRARSGRSSSDLRATLGVAPYQRPALRGAGASSACGSRPQRLLDLLLRTGRDGDWFGLRPRGLSRREAAPPPARRRARRPRSPPACCSKRVRHPGGSGPAGPAERSQPSSRACAGVNGDDPGLPAAADRPARAALAQLVDAQRAAADARRARAARCACTQTTPSAHGLEDGGLAVLASKCGERRGAGRRSPTR